MTEPDSDTPDDVSKLSRREFVAAGSALATTGALSSMSEVSEAANFASPVDFKGAYIGPDSDKPGLGAKGWLYFTDDGTGTVYKHDGSSWVDIGIGGGSSEWEVDSDGDLAPKDGEPVSVDEERISHADWNDRPIWSTGDKTVTVPGDYSTIQAAIDDCPILLRHQYKIDVDDGDYSNEDLVVRGVFSIDQGTADYPGENVQLQIVGNASTPSNVTVGSINAFGCSGVETPFFRGFEVTGEEQKLDESASVNASGCGELHLQDINLRGTGLYGVQAYRSTLAMRRVDFGTDIYDRGIRGKREATIYCRDTPGSTVNQAYEVFEGSIIQIGTQGAKLDGDPIENVTTGMILDREAGPVFSTWNIREFGNLIQVRDEYDNGMHFEYSSFPDSGEVKHFKAGEKGYGGYAIEDLSGQTGAWDGQTRLDDGTNTVSRCTECVWDDVNGVWRPKNNPDGGSFS